MRRKLILGAFLAFVSWAVNSCTALSDCKICKTVTTDSSTGQVTEGNETKYCGNELIAVELTLPVTIGTQTTKYQCR